MVLLAIALTVIIGAAVVRLLDGDAGWPSLLGNGFLVGTAIVTATLSLAAWIGTPSLRTTLMIASGLLAAIGLTSLIRSGSPGEARSFRDPVVLMALAIVAAFLIGHALDAVTVPIGTWDFFSIWGLKGRVFFETGGVDWNLLRDPDYAFAHPEYPVLLPLYLAYFATMMGSWNDAALGLVFTAFAASTALVLFAALRERVGSREASLGLLVVISPFLLPVLGYADGPLAAYLLAGVVSLDRYRRLGGRGRAILAGVLLGCAALTKIEGLAAAILLAILASFAWRRLLFPVVIAAAVGFSWPAVRFLRHVPARFRDLSIGSFSENVSRASELLRLLATSFPTHSSGVCSFWPSR